MPVADAVSIASLTHVVVQSFESSLSKFVNLDLHSRSNIHARVGLRSMLGQPMTEDLQMTMRAAGLELAREVNESRWCSIAKVPIDYTQHRNPHNSWLCLQTARSQVYVVVVSPAQVDVIVFGVR